MKSSGGGEERKERGEGEDIEKHKFSPGFLKVLPTERQPVQGARGYKKPQR